MKKAEKNTEINRHSNIRFLLKTLRNLSGLTLCFSILSVSVFGQLTASPDKGFQAGNSYSISDIESVNMNSGNVSVNIPLASLPKGRGTAPGFTISLTYNSKLWDSVQQWEEDGHDEFNNQADYVRNLLSPAEDAGWNVFIEYKMKIVERTSPNPGVTVPRYEKCVPFNDNYSKNGYAFRVQMRMPGGGITGFRPYGTGHHYDDYHKDGFFEIAPNGQAKHSHLVTIVNDPDLGTYASCSDTTPQVTTSGMHYYSTDGSNVRLFVPYNSGSGQNSEDVNWLMYYPNGTVVENLPPDDTTIRQRITDINGNRVKIKSDTHNSISGVKIIDDLGRFIFYGGNKVIQSGVGGEELETTLSWKTEWVYKNYKTVALFSGITIPQSKMYTDAYQSFTMLDKITLPTQASSLEYKFTYHAGHTDPYAGSPPYDYTDGWGELASVELPGGAIAEYSYDLPENENGLTNYIEIVANKIIRKDLNYSETYDFNTTEKTDTWEYDIQSGVSSVTAPNGGVTTQYFYDKSPYIQDESNDWRSGLVYKVVNPDGSFSEKTWKQQGDGSTTNGEALNAFVSEEKTTITDASGTAALIAKREFDYDQNSNLLETREYDWKPVSSGTFALKRKTQTVFYHQTLPMASTTNDSNYYANPNSPTLLGLPKSSEVRDGSGNPFSRSEIVYDNTPSAPVKGNATKTIAWDSYKGGTARAYSDPLTTTNSIETSATYDSYGNVLTTTDANGVSNQMTFGAINGFSGLYPTEAITAYNETEERTATSEYDFYTGLVTSATDEDNNVTNETEYDALGRPVETIAAAGTALSVSTTTEYNDLLRRVVVRSDLETLGDGKKVAVQHYDELGRVRLSRSIENIATEDPYDEEDGIKVQTRYLSGNPNSYQLSSNPYRAATSAAATNEPSMGWTRSKAENTGRKSETETFSGAGLPAPWGSNSVSSGKVLTELDAERTLVTDQAGKKRISKTNALGQLTDVWEIKASDSDTEAISIGNPVQNLNGYKTSYQYDTLNNLKTVNQGVQARTFTYSSLSRLLTANNPESGTIAYVYDNNGNLTKKTDARQVETSYVYDNINRVTYRSYTNVPGTGTATPPVTYVYDNLSGRKGQLTKVQNSYSTTEYTAFNILGNVTKSKQTTDGTAYNEMEYSYNLSGALIETKYPSGRIVKNELDNDGMLANVTSKKAGETVFRQVANNFKYTAAGAVESMQYGNGRFETMKFNSRLQPTQIGLGHSTTNQGLLKLDYDYGTTDNNGNVKSQTITVPTVGQFNGFNAVQTYTYDELNRLKSAVENLTPTGGSATETWKQTYTFDRYGNRRFEEANTTTLPKNCGTPPNLTVCTAEVPVVNPTIDPETNKLIGYTFDTAGNTKVDAEDRTFIYDGENKQIEVKDSSSNVIGQYFYDGDGKRVKKLVPSTGETTIFHYDAAGKLVAEYSTVVEPVSTAQTSYLTNDHLGSPRAITNQFGEVTSRRDFQPYGEEIYSSDRTSGIGYSGDSVRQQFTGYEEDNESGLDFAQARYYSSQHGRFITVDPLMASAVITVSQSWNRYAYVTNNPLKYNDPTGEDYSDLTKEQRRVFDTYVASVNATGQASHDAAGLDEGPYEPLSAEAVYAGLSESQQTTFESVTHALEKSSVTDKKTGKPVSALSLVKGLTQITGYQKGKGGREQFRLLVELEEDAVQKLGNSREFNSGSSGHVYKDGRVAGAKDFRQDNGPPSIQISFLDDNTTGDIDVDYRSQANPAAHLSPCNSDIACGTNYARHNEQYGKQDPLRNIPRRRERSDF